MNIQVDSVVGSNGQSSPSFPEGIDIGQNIINNYGNLNLSGISSLSVIKANTSISDTVYSSSYVGDGSGLTGLTPSTTPSRIVALKYLLSDPPLRS